MKIETVWPSTLPVKRGPQLGNPKKTDYFFL